VGRKRKKTIGWEASNGLGKKGYEAEEDSNDWKTKKKQKEADRPEWELGHHKDLVAVRIGRKRMGLGRRGESGWRPRGKRDNV